MEERNSLPYLKIPVYKVVSKEIWKMEVFFKFFSEIMISQETSFSMIGPRIPILILRLKNICGGYGVVREMAGAK